MTLFETDRLRCRALEPGDLAALLAVYGDAEAMRFVGDGSPLAEAQARRWLEVTRDNYARRGYGMAALLERASGEVVGFCGLVHPGGQDDAELKYAFLPTHWGRGYATEAARGMLEHGRRAHGLARVIATVHPEHSASQNVLRKAGMELEEVREDEEGSTLVFAWRAG